MKQLGFLYLIYIVSFTAITERVFAYRPFVSTDAAVAEKKVWEIELGFVNVSHDENKDEIEVPSLRVNYGILKNWEFVGEFDAQIYEEEQNQDFEIKDPALFLKGVLRDGIMQNQQGESFAVELGVLLLSTVEGERDAGLEGIAILSGKISEMVTI